MIVVCTIVVAYAVNLLSEGAPPGVRTIAFPILTVGAIGLIIGDVLWNPGERRKPSEAVRRQMVRRVEATTRTWIEHTLATVPRLQLRASVEYRAAHGPQEQGTGGGRQSGTVVVDSETIARVFDDAGRSMLLLGGGGSGKTVLLADLCLRLCRDAHTDSSPAIPVLVSFSSWSGGRIEFARWLCDTIVDSYPGVSSRVVRDLIEDRSLILLLDGLDEIPTAAGREHALRELGVFLANGPCPVVVTCRRDDVGSLAIPPVITHEVEILQPEHDEVRRYLVSLGTPAASAAAAVSGRDATWWSLISTPLMLGIIAQVSSAAPDLKLVTAGTAKRRRRHILDCYVNALVDRRAGSGTTYPAAEVRRWLSWLAFWLKSHGRSEFHVDRIAPSWISDVTSVSSVKARPRHWLLGVISALGMSMLVSGEMGGIVDQLVLLFDVVPVLVLTAWHMNRFHRSVSEPIRLVWRMRSRKWIVGLLLAIPLSVAGVVTGSHLFGIDASPAKLVLSALASVATLAPIPLLYLLIPQGLDDRVEMPAGARIRRSWRNAWLAACVVGLPLAVGVVLVRSLHSGSWALGIGTSAPLVVLYVWCGWLVVGGGAAMQYRALFREIAKTKRGPSDYLGFLRWAQDRLLLQPVGSAVRFPHREIRDHLARSWSPISSDR